VKRLVLAGTLTAALALGGTAAQAHHTTQPTTPKSHSKSCTVVKRAFIVSGDHASFTGAKNADGTYTGDLTLSPNHANHAAHKSGVDTKAHTPITLHLENTRVKLGGVTDFTMLQATDKIKVIGKIPYAKKGGHGKNACPDAGFGADRYDSDHITVRQVVAHRPSTTS
jgi:hypothetical protein